MRRQRQVTLPTQYRYATIAATCDRCGSDIAVQRRSGDLDEVPGTFHGDFVCMRDEEWKADLCAECTTAVREFIDSGAGGGVQILYHDPMGS